MYSGRARCMSTVNNNSLAIKNGSWKINNLITQNVLMRSITGDKLSNSNLRKHFLWPPCVADADIIFLRCGFFLFIPRLISAIADWMSTILPHMVWS